MTKVHRQLKPWIHTIGSEPHRGMLVSYIPVIHKYLWSVHLHMVGGTDQGVAQLQQEFFTDFDAQLPPAATFPRYT